ncbi:MAG: DegT/DnrJ/EryC1/StrS family aminotransferase, partial [Dongiaceae bacterium]
MNVPLLDLVAQYAAIKDDVLPALLRVIEAQQFIMGPAIPQLESEIAALSRAKHGVGCASGTDALLLPLMALDLQPGDEVITPTFTFFATAGTVHNAGGRPVFVDLEPDTFNVDPAAVEAAITRRTRAIIPVHLFGQMAAMERLLPLAERRGLRVIEDAAQAIGARRRAGTGRD